MPITVQGWRTPNVAAVVSLVDPATPAGQQPQGVTGRTLTFSEEFNSPLIDVDTTNGYIKCRSDGPQWACWYPDWPQFSTEDPINRNHTNTGSTSYYQRNRVSTSAGALVLDAIQDFPSNKNYSAGMIQSLPSFTVAAGTFVETRVRVSGVLAGMQPAAWLTAAAYDAWPPEIDFYEVSTSAGTINQNVFNTGDPDYVNQVSGLDWSSSTWHTLACDWQANQVVFYIDGAVKSSVPRTLPGSQYLVLDMSTYSSAAFASVSVYFDYIRVWQ